MGGDGSGNFLPKQAALPEEKSFNRSIRLNPRKESHRWLNERMNEFQAQQAVLPEGERRSLADWFVDLLLFSEGHQPFEQTVIASSSDVAEIRDIVQYIMERVTTFELSAKTPKKGRQAKVDDLQISEPMRSTIDRYIERGYTGGSDLDEDRF